MKQESNMNINSIFLIVIIGLMGWGLAEINSLGKEFASVKQEIVDASLRLDKVESRVDRLDSHVNNLDTHAVMAK